MTTNQIEVAPDASPEARLEAMFKRAEEPRQGVEEEEVTEEVQAQDVDVADADGATADDAEPAQTDDDGEEVEYEGKAYKLPKELKDALLRQSDYTRKTQEVAEKRKQVEERETFLQASEQIRAAAFEKSVELHTIDQQIKQYNELDWNALADADTAQFLKLDRQFRSLVEKRNSVLGEMQTVWQKQQQQEAEHLSKLVQEGQKELSKRIPGFSKEVQTKIAQTAEQYGFQAKELQGLYDPRQVHVLHDAMKWRELQAKTATTSNKVAQAKPIQVQARSSSTSQTRAEIDAARQHLKKTGKGAEEVLRRMFEAKARKR